MKKSSAGKKSGKGKGAGVNAGVERFSMSKQHNREIWEGAKKEGKADERMKSICDFINSTKNFFTSSGCAGRILLLGIPASGSKKDAYFHRKWHRDVEFKELWEGIKAKAGERGKEEEGKEMKGNERLGKKGVKAKTNYEDELWFKLEPFIIHIGADTLGNARKLLRIMREAGEKRGGLIVAKDGKFIAEIVGTQAMGMPVKSRGKILVDEEYMKHCLNDANKKLGKNYGMLERLEKECRERMG